MLDKDKVGRILKGWVERIRMPDSSRPATKVTSALISLTIHALFLVSLAFAGHQVHEVAQTTFSSEVYEPSSLEPLKSDSTLQDIDQSDERPVLEASGSFAPILATSNVRGAASAATPAMADEALAALDMDRRDVTRAMDVIAPSATMQIGRAHV